MNHTSDNLLVRKDAKDLTPEEKQRFVNAVLALKNRPSSYTIFNPYTNATETPPNAYDYYVRLHQIAFGQINASGQMVGDMPPVHGTPPFLPWHREFIRRFEQDLQAVDPGVTLPYWDATNSQSTQATFSSDLMGGTGNPQNNYAVGTGPFRAGAWTITYNSASPINPNGQAQYLQRTFGSRLDPSEFFGTANLPTAADVEAALRQPTYDRFRPTVEATPHGRPHVWVGGPMGLATSPNDPVFFMHHANIDRLWSQWIERHQNEPGFRAYLPSNGDGVDINDPMFGFGNATPEMVLSTSQLGYIYDTDPQRPDMQPTIPAISISDVTLAEGSTPSQATPFNFTVSLSEASDQMVTVNYAIADSSINGTKSFDAVLTGNEEVPSTSSKATGMSFLQLDRAGDALSYSIKVAGLDFGPLLGQAAQTPDTADDVVGAHFHVGAKGANGPIVLDLTNNKQDADWKATINADGTTSITGIWDAKDAANQPLSNFVASLQKATPGDDTNLYLNIHTTASPKGAIRGQIFGERPDATAAALNGQVKFNPGETKQTITVNVLGDTQPEFDDVFFINLSNPVGATLADAQGVGTIRDDDFKAGTGGSSNLPVPPQMGGNGSDTLTGGKASDTLMGEDGDDICYGGDSDDFLAGGSGQDLFYGDDGDDKLYGNQGADTLYGGKGKNALYGGQGDDVIYGDGEDDFLVGDKGGDRLYVKGKGKYDLYGNTDHDTLYGGEGSETLHGGKDEDILYGGAGNDAVYGDKGNDTLIGVDPKAANAGFGEIDTLVGGDGADIFVLGDGIRSYYNDGKDANPGFSDYALIADFEAKQDFILLQGSVTGYELVVSSGNLPAGTAIYQKTVGQNELIAIVQGSTDLNLLSSRLISSLSSQDLGMGQATGGGEMVGMPQNHNHS